MKWNLSIRAVRFGFEFEFESGVVILLVAGSVVMVVSLVAAVVPVLILEIEDIITRGGKRRKDG